MRMIVSGGGTSGHVSPVLATVDALRSTPNPPDILFIGARGGVEAGLAREAGLPFKGIFGGKLRRLPGAGMMGNMREWRYLSWNLRDLLYLLLGTLQALWIMGRFRPAVIFNKSGPPGFPVGIAARILGIPMVLHEPDITPGLGTRVMGRWAVRIATGFPVNLYPAALQTKLVYTGTPVQPVMLQGKKAEGRRRFRLREDAPVVLVVGGSQGARELNSALITCLPELLPYTQILHVTGKREAARVGEGTRQFNEDAGSSLHPYRLEPWLSAPDMADAYAAADIVVARAGASTIAELAALGKPSVLVPNTEAAAHQVQNARQLQQAEAVVVASKDPAVLSGAVRRLLENPKRRQHYGTAISAFNAPDAAERLAAVLLAAGSHS